MKLMAKCKKNVKSFTSLFKYLIELNLCITSTRDERDINLGMELPKSMSLLFLLSSCKLQIFTSFCHFHTGFAQVFQQAGFSNPEIFNG
jgi:hypothetical protein